jgi:hypothetical protein
VTAKADDPATMRPKPTAAPPSHLYKRMKLLPFGVPT